MYLNSSAFSLNNTVAHNIKETYPNKKHNEAYLKNSPQLVFAMKSITRNPQTIANKMQITIIGTPVLYPSI
jgi:hypothetical protein